MNLAANDRIASGRSAGGRSFKADADDSLAAADDPQRFINRELSWIAFNERVLQEAENPAHPLLERVRFLSISDSNLSEFYAVRVAGLRGQERAGVTTCSADGLTPREQLGAIRSRAVDLMRDQQACWDALSASLRGEGIAVIEAEELSDDDRAWLRDRFVDEIFPVLTPVAIDSSHPFPFIANFTLTLALRLLPRDSRDPLTGLVVIPPGLPRFVALPGATARHIAIERIVPLFFDQLFPGFDIDGHGVFHVIRDCDIEIEEEAEDLVRVFEAALRERRRGSLVRLTIEASMPADLGAFIQRQLGAVSDDVFPQDGLLALADVDQLIGTGRPDLTFPDFHVRFPERIRDFDNDCFAAIRQKDILVHHPYESFEVVVQFLNQAARDPDVVAIKQTLYRTGENSPIVAALIEAVEAGKSVTALVELKARFEEERNIRWARDLERAGVQVVYGFFELKIHAKVSLVIRRERRGLRSYVHFGTGNYHPVNARTYTDLSYFTCNKALCRDAAKLFNYMTGTAKPESMEKLVVSPINLRQSLAELIAVEIANVAAGRPAGILMKLNSLVDPEIIDELYRASQAGVPIDLVIRGICSLRPGIPGLSENIRVRSIVGRFLEHSRIVCFAAGHGLQSRRAKVFISSADLMQRNLDRRIETLVPIENRTVHRQILDRIMKANVLDNVQSWFLAADGSYRRASGDGTPYSAHAYFIKNPSLSGRGSALKNGRKPASKRKAAMKMTRRRRAANTGLGVSTALETDSRPGSR